MKAIRKSLKADVVKVIDIFLGFVPDWVQESIDNYHLTITDYGIIYLKTPHGDMKAKDGDWLVREMDGYIYPFSQKTFEKSFNLS